MTDIINDQNIVELLFQLLPIVEQSVDEARYSSTIEEYLEKEQLLKQLKFLIAA